MSAGLVHTAFLSAAETFLNGLLALDPVSPARLAALGGKSLHVVCTFPPVGFTMLVTDDRILMLQGNGDDATASLRGSAGALLGLLVQKGSAARRERIAFSGDADFLEALQDVLANLDVDWEYQLSKVIGDVPTQAASDGLASARGFARKSAVNLRDDLDAWLHEERRLFPDGAQLETFYTAVDRLRLRIDRLDARTNRLQSRLTR